MMREHCEIEVGVPLERMQVWTVGNDCLEPERKPAC